MSHESYICDCNPIEGIPQNELKDKKVLEMYVSFPLLVLMSSPIVSSIVSHPLGCNVLF